jgi:hypothetical protein
MTNLITAGVITILATNTVTLKTNVIETFNDPSPNANLTNFMLPSDYGRAYVNPPPTTKWRITDVTEENRLSFTWNGRAESVGTITSVSRTITKMKRKEEWEVAK